MFSLEGNGTNNNVHAFFHIISAFYGIPYIIYRTAKRG